MAIDNSTTSIETSGFVGDAVRAHRLLSQGIVPDGLLRDPIAKSWRRSIDLGADYGRTPDAYPNSRSALSEAKERDHELLICAEPFMDSLYEEIQGSSSLVMLTDARGTVLRATIDADFRDAASRAGATPGAEWREETRGTNAMSIVLADKIPAEVLGPEHFLPSNAAFACAAAPIFDPTGHLRGVLDATTDFRAGKTHSIALVRLFAKTIENQLLQSACTRECLTLHFHMRPQFIGTPWEGIALIAPNEAVHSANACGRSYLLSPDAQMGNAQAAFGMKYSELADHARRRLSPLLRLRSPSGQVLYAKIEFGRSDSMPGLAFDQKRPRRASQTIVPIPEALQELDTGDLRVKEVIQRAARIVGRDISLMILGETGTGKELLARAFHASGPRSKGPFVAVNCASIPEGLIESELFGYNEGAFTGARRRGSPGKVLQASGGTLFLDEIGDMPESMQSRLLRVLQEREVVPLGGEEAHKVDVSVVSATHRDLKRLIAKGQFRQDLYYRLNGLVVCLPPLRERTDRASLIANICQHESDRGEPISVDREVTEIFERHPWPGNVRQLQQVLRTAIVMLGDEPIITKADLCAEFMDDVDGLVTASPASETANPARGIAPDDGTRTQNLHQLESDFVLRVMASNGGNISATATQLGISRNTVYRVLRSTGRPSTQNNH